MFRTVKNIFVWNTYCMVFMLRFIMDTDENTDISSIDLESGAETYLINGGMKSEEIGALKEKLLSGTFPRF